MIHIYLPILASFVLMIPSANNEPLLWEQLRLGNLDSVREISPGLPDSSAASLLLKGMFEPDAEKAKKRYESLEKSYPQSLATPHALERLKFYFQISDPVKSEQYGRALKDRFPNYRTPAYGWFQENPAENNFKTEPPAPKVAKIPPETQQFAGQVWSIQVGAFKSRKGAEATGQIVKRFGPVNYVDRTVEGSKLIAVQVGRFSTKYDAEQTAAKISTATSLKTTVVRAGQ